MGEREPFFGRAVVLMLATSDPLPTSLTPRQARMSPAMEGARNCRFSSSEPNRDSAGVAISVMCVCVCVHECVLQSFFSRKHPESKVTGL